MTLLPDEKEGRPGGYTETADQKTSHDQATSTADSNPSEPQQSIAETLDFRGLLSVLLFADDEYVSVCHRAGNGPFLSEVCAPGDAPAVVAALPKDADIWFGVCPVNGPARKNAGRGRAKDVTRLSALWADLDVGDNKCASVEVALSIINELSEVLATRPMAVTATGHGLHPYWVVEDGTIADHFTNDGAAALLDRWKRLVNEIAQMNAAKVDSVFDLARVLRVPGTYNNKGLR
jgi:hypothetical protein